MRERWREILSILARTHPVFHQVTVHEPRTHVEIMDSRPYDWQEDEGLTGPRCLP